MSKEMAVIAFGVWVAVIPYLGIPGSWRTAILVLTGIALMSLGFFLRAEVLSRGMKRGRHHPFVENSGASQAEYANDQKQGIRSLN